jgi:hypothetical protein
MVAATESYRTFNFEVRGNLERLWDALEARTCPPVVLLTGPAGTGKSFSIVMMLHLLSLRTRGLRILLARKTRRSLTESILAMYEDEILPLTGHTALARGPDRANRNHYTYPNGTRWVLGGLDNPERVKSSSYDIAFLNEGTEFEEGDLGVVRTRVGRPDRVAGIDAVLIDTNPSIASHWLKRWGDDGRLAFWETHHADNPALYDEKSETWTRAGTRYITRNLQPLRGSMRKRMLEGLWVAGDGAFFADFEEERHVSAHAEYDRALDAYLAVDSGHHAGAVWFQVDGPPDMPRLRVFGDHYSQGVKAYQFARDVLAKSHELCGHEVAEVWADPAGKLRNEVVDTTVLEEYERAGLTTTPWVRRNIKTGMKLLEGLIAWETPRLLIHPRCTNLITAMGNYMRKRTKDGQWLDDPADPQHPFEETVDCLRCGALEAIEMGGVAWGRNPLANWRG